MINVSDLKHVTVKSLRFDGEAWDGILFEHKGYGYIFEMHYAGGGVSYSVTCVNSYKEEEFYYESNRLSAVKKRVSL